MKFRIEFIPLDETMDVESEIDSLSYDGAHARLCADRDGMTVWFTGLSGAGKTTICETVYLELLARRVRAEILDGDEIRRHLSPDLGFSKAERDENVRRIAFVANLLCRNGVVTLVSAISPYRAIRDEVRNKIARFLEVHVNAPLAVCELRDPKGLYKRARAGEIRGFTGIDDPYEEPLHPEVRCDTHLESAATSSQRVLSAILRFRVTASSAGADRLVIG